MISLLSWIQGHIFSEETIKVMSNGTFLGKFSSPSGKKHALCLYLTTIGNLYWQTLFSLQKTACFFLKCGQWLIIYCRALNKNLFPPHAWGYLNSENLSFSSACTKSTISQVSWNNQCNLFCLTLKSALSENQMELR